MTSSSRSRTSKKFTNFLLTQYGTEKVTLVTFVFLVCALHVILAQQQEQHQITTIVGSGSCSVSADNMQAKLANINFPTGIVIIKPESQQESGMLAFSDTSNHKIRAVDMRTMMIQGAVGTASPGFSGDMNMGFSAQVNGPVGLANDGKLFYIADTNNHRVRVVNTTNNIIDTFAGTGVPGFTGNGNNPKSAQLNRPIRVAVDSAKNLVFILEEGNARVRVVNRTSNQILPFVGM